MDLSTVTFFTNATTEIQVLAVSQQCFKCSYNLLGNISIAKNFTHFFDTRWPTNFKFLNNNQSKIVAEHFVEHGKYIYSVYETSSDTLLIDNKITNSPALSFLPLIYLLVVLVAASIIWPLGKFIYRTFRHGNFVSDSDYFLEMEEWESKIDTISKSQQSSKNELIVRKPARIRSIDTFRGIAIVLMVFVNYGGGQYYFIDHSVWNGLSLSDLVFPWFIFIMGLSINLSHKRLLKQENKKLAAFWIICTRSIKIFLIGFILNAGKNLPTWRIPGVLQRIGISYFIVASFNLFTAPSEQTIKRFASIKWVSHLCDIIPFGIQWLFIFCLLAIHTAITFRLPVPGCPTGYLGPGGLSEGGKYFYCTGGAAGYIDKLVFGEKHLYRNPSLKNIYLTKQNFDPEGLLGYLTSIVLTFFGLQAGRIMFMYKSHKSQVLRWFIWTLITGGIAFGLTSGSLNNGLIPINKNLWSLSFVMATSATSFLLFSFCYILCDIFHVWNGSPFFFCGVNSMFIYIGHSLVSFNIYWNEQDVTHISSLVVATFGTSIWVTSAFWLHLKKQVFTV
ncbi:heparan-alpha-glucosaminide N-acetyltransferase isoform X1 [Hydra vulgaris]|uniref:heparan-alpha-glucosaminide N-acetyltransferase isoform X1 n=1 Tax=Hydra vulgaris TaxID=6087 RepID=UPI001F5E44EB|nr:heparan-alpha-glucosaminide N-acetyltransferase isoform X1 [Hydra vulgaris]